MEIQPISHEDSIWTWKSMKSRKAMIWIPYLDRIEKEKQGKSYHWTLYYNREGRDSLVLRLSQVESLLIYGATEATLPIRFISDLCDAKIPLLLHHRNGRSPALLYAPPSYDHHDRLTSQIIARENLTRRAHIAKALLLAKLSASQRILPAYNVSEDRLKKIRSLRSLSQIMVEEAQEAKRYWELYYAQFSLTSIVSRRSKSQVNDALNALSFFMAGIMLRWILMHGLSPAHAFLHTSTHYPSLIYDLLEPFRYLIELSVMEAWGDLPAESKTSDLVSRSLVELKKKLEQTVYVPSMQIQLRRKNLMHGEVLSLLAYLSGEMKRFFLPTEGPRNGGRPVKTSFYIPGTLR